LTSRIEWAESQTEMSKFLTRRVVWKLNDVLGLFRTEATPAIFAASGSPVVCAAATGQQAVTWRLIFMQALGYWPDPDEAGRDAAEAPRYHSEKSPATIKFAGVGEKIVNSSRSI